MSSPFVIQPLDNRFCQDIVNLILPIQQQEFHVPITLGAQQDLLDIEGHYIAAGGGFWGALHNGELVGTVALMSMGHQSGALRKMFVKKEFRGKHLGVATALLEVLLTFCKAHDITDIYLGTVEMLKAAHRFYERNGFEAVACDDLPPYFPRMMADNRFYKLNIKQHAG